MNKWSILEKGNLVTTKHFKGFSKRSFWFKKLLHNVDVVIAIVVVGGASKWKKKIAATNVALQK